MDTFEQEFTLRHLIHNRRQADRDGQVIAANLSPYDAECVLALAWRPEVIDVADDLDLRIVDVAGNFKLYVVVLDQIVDDQQEYDRERRDPGDHPPLYLMVAVEPNAPNSMPSPLHRMS